MIKPLNKIDYIIQNYFDVLNNFVWPFVSTADLLFIVPYGENKVYKTYLGFKQERQKLKGESEAKRRLTIEESDRIRTEMSELIEEHRKEVNRTQSLLDGRDKTITEFREDTNKLKILYAGYGAYPDKFVEVTGDLSKAVSGNALSFSVNNNVFSIQDSAPTILKDFFIVFQVNGKVRSC